MSLTKRPTGRYWAFCFTALLAVVLFTSPGVVAMTKSADSNQHTKRHVSINDNGSVTDMSVRYTNDEKSLKLKAKLKGELKFNADESEIISFPANSKFDLTVDQDGMKRRVVIKSNRSADRGQATYTYYEDGDELAYDASAQAWFAQIIPEILRTTGLDAEARVKRIQTAYGDDAVLDEIALISSGWVKKTYFGHLFDLSVLNNKDLNRAMDLATEVESDFELSHVLNKLTGTQAVNSEAQWIKLLGSTESIQSDFEMAKTLINFLDELPQSADINQAYFNAATNIQSDFEMTKVLMKYVGQQPPNSVNLTHMFELATEIQSDFELAKLLLSVNPQLNQTNGDADGVFGSYIDLSTSIQSDFEIKKVYSNLLKYELTNNNLSQIIDSAEAQISSDFELANLLLEILEQKQLNQNQKDQIKEAARNSISSKYERNKVLLAVL